MINYQVQVEFDKCGITELHSKESKVSDSANFWATATIVKLDSESLHFYFIKKSVGDYLMSRFFLDNRFLMKDNFSFSEQLHLALRLPDNSMIPAGQYSCRDMGSRIAVQFSYSQIGESIGSNPEELIMDSKSRLKAA